MNRNFGHRDAGLRRRAGADAVAESQVCSGHSTRRAFLLAAGAWLTLAKAGAVLAQPKQAPIVIGWLNVASRESGGHWLAAFKDGLAAFGWKEGSQFVIEERWAAGQYDRLRPLAEELAAKKPALIVAAPSQSVAAAAKAAPQTPIVHATGSDPVAAGFAASLARPGGMITGLSNVATDVTEKHLELLLAAVPRLKRIGFLTDARNVNRALLMKAAERSVAQRSVEARFAEVARPDEIEPAISRLAKEGAQALVVFASPLLNNERQRIVKLALAYRWAIIGPQREFADAGALLSYGADTSANFRRAAYYVDRILKGAKPGDLPMEQPTKLELIVNAKTAKALGLSISPEILLRADQVIE
jgi:putative ABC transport system substrate-binding protein